MKTESTTGDPVWTNNVELLSNEECLPVIGSCQVSSILSTLDATVPENSQNMDLLILPNNDYKIPIAENDDNFHTNYVVVKETGVLIGDKPKIPYTVKECHNGLGKVRFFVCSFCPFICAKKSKINDHFSNAHQNKTTRPLMELDCPGCPNIFNHKMSLKSHLIHDHGVSNSDLSGIIQAMVHSAKAKTALKGKLQEIEGNTSCKSEITSVKILENDYDNSNGANDFQPNGEDCEKRLNEVAYETKLIELPQMDGEKLFNNLLKPTADPLVSKYVDAKKSHKCILPTCKVRLLDIDKLNYHIESHTKNGFKCQECNETFSFWKPLTGHLWRVHKVDMELYSCDKCDYKSFSLSKLNNIHKLIHSDFKAFVCDECQKAFKNSKQLGNHKIIHKRKSDRLLFVCEVCLKNFSCTRQLKVHMDVVHNKIKPYLCSYCGYKGSSKSSLKMHIRQHTGERPFACDSCSYTTSDHNSLRRHKLRHSGQKPYKCAHCSYACIQSSTYKVHIKTKHPGLEKDLMFTCHECQFRSVNKDIYTSHMITVHKQKPQATQTTEEST